MPKEQSPNIDKERSPPRQPRLSLATNSPGRSAVSPPQPSTLANHPTTVDAYTQTLPTYSQTILQPPTLATDPSGLPPPSFSPGPQSASSRRQSSSSMRNASMTFENITPTSTPTGRISKAKKGKRVHACEFPGCGKVFTRAEHRRRHELNHNPDSIFKCQQIGCNKSFHRLDLLQRHQERHEVDASPVLGQTRPHHATVYSSPPSMIPSQHLVSASPDNNTRTTSGPISIPNLVNHHPQQRTHFASGDASLGYSLYMSYPTVDFYGSSDGGHSPGSDHFYRHRPSISSNSSVAGGFDYASISPTMTASIPGYTIAATAAPPVVVPSTFDDSQAYIHSPTVNSGSLHGTLRPERDGVEFATIQQRLSDVPGLIFESARSELPRYIRSDCLEHYWKYFHPSFPILYKPNFVTGKPPPLLLSAVLAIGSFYDSRPDAKLYSLALLEIGTSLLERRENTTTKSQKSQKSQIADYQTVLLLEVLSKYCARHTSSGTSARFRQLYASLHQSRQILAQNPLSLFKALKSDKAEDGLSRAHQFWLDHEARRRIFHACAILDSQQVFLFNQRPTILSHPNVSKLALDSQGVVDLPCDEDLWEASSITEWSKKAANYVPQNINIARKEYETKALNEYSFFQHQIINMPTGMMQRSLDEAETPPRSHNGPSKTLFNHHIFQMAQSTPVRQLLIVAGESWFIGEKIESQTDYEAAKQTVRDWITTVTLPIVNNIVPDTLKAFWHALKALRMITNFNEGSKPFLSTNMLHEDWAVYLVALVCWAHWYFRSRPQSGTHRRSVPQSISTSPSNSRKRKNDETEQPSKRRKPTLPGARRTMPAPSMAAHTTSAPVCMPSSTYATPAYPAYAADHSFAATWAGSFYDAQIGVFSAPSAATTVVEREQSVYTSSTTPTAMTRTATNTPQSRSSRATTAVPTTTTATAVDDQLIDFRIYLGLTDVPDALSLAHLDQATLDRTRSVLSIIRIHKVGEKRIVGGLMNDAERILSRLIEGRSTEMF